MTQDFMNRGREKIEIYTSFRNFLTKLSQKLPNLTESIDNPEVKVFQIVPRSSMTNWGISNNLATFAALSKNLGAVFPD